jgi:hypothetical protein
MRTPVLFLARAGLAQSCTGLRRLPSLTRATVERTCGDVLFLLSQDGPLCGPRASLCGDHPRGSGSACGPATGAASFAAYPSPCRLPTRTTCKLQESLPAVPGRGSTACKGRTCADRRAGVRTTYSGCAGAKRTWASCCPWQCWMFWPSYPFISWQPRASHPGPRHTAFTCCVRLQSTSCRRRRRQEDKT